MTLSVTVERFVQKKIDENKNIAMKGPVSKIEEIKINI